MASRRMIDPSFWQSESLMEVDYRQRLLFLGLVSNADDQGRLKGNPKLVKAAVFPFDDISANEMQSDLDALVEVECIAIYKSGSKTCIQILNWWEYQHPQWAYPSELPPMNGWKDQLRYRKGGEVLTDNWKGESKPDSFDAEPPTGSALNGSEADCYAHLPKETPKALPKEMGKASGGSIVVGLGLEVSDKKPITTTAQALTYEEMDDGSDLGFGARQKDKDEGYAKIVKAYESEIGVISPMASSMLGDTLDEIRQQLYENPQGSETAEQWILYGIQQAVEKGVRNWSYASKVLDGVKKSKSLSAHKINGTKKPKERKYASNSRYNKQDKAEQNRVANTTGHMSKVFNPYTGETSQRVPKQ